MKKQTLLILGACLGVYVLTHNSNGSARGSAVKKAKAAKPTAAQTAAKQQQRRML
jgi:hypothetical protein